jgi:hypothetical protein
MPNLLETGAAWLGEQLQAHAGRDCTYLHGASILDISLIAMRQRVDQLGIPETIVAFVDNFTATASDLNNSGVPFVPEVGDVITWTDSQDLIRTSVVFPIYQRKCFRFTDSSNSRIKLFAVAQEDLTTLRITPSGQSPVDVISIVGSMRAQEQYVDVGQTTKILTTVAYVPRDLLTAAGITTPPLMATATVHGLEGWTINGSETEWGPGLVKLGLERESLTREWQARRDASV